MTTLGGCIGLGRRDKKNLLFLKKKKQKDFYSFAICLIGRKRMKSFLVLFFKKELLSFLILTAFHTP